MTGGSKFKRQELDRVGESGALPPLVAEAGLGARAAEIDLLRKR